MPTSTSASHSSAGTPPSSCSRRTGSGAIASTTSSAPSEPRGHQRGEARGGGADADRLAGRRQLVQALDEPAGTAVQAQPRRGVDQDATGRDLLDGQAERVELAQQPGGALLQPDRIGRHETEAGAEGERLRQRHPRADAAGLGRRRGQPDARLAERRRSQRERLAGRTGRLAPCGERAEERKPGEVQGEQHRPASLIEHMFVCEPGQPG